MNSLIIGIIGRVEDEKFVLDFRSVLDDEIPSLCEKINTEFKA